MGAAVVRVVVNGVGRLGKAIVGAASEVGPEASGVTVVAGVDANPASDTGMPIYPALGAVEEDFDLIIDASKAEALDGVVDFAVANQKALVVAATGHSEAQLEKLEVAAESIPVFRASNLSLGVNVLRRLTEQAGKMLGPVDAEIVEVHHRLKVDAPSGTAFTLAEALRDATDPEREFVYGRSPEDIGARGNEIGIHAVRGGTVVGEHTVTFLLDDEIVELRHVAQSRQVFGFGALRAAAFTADQKPGLYSMADLLG